MIFDAHSIELTTSPPDLPPSILTTAEPRLLAPLPRAILYTVLTLFTALFVWSFFGRIDIVATARGQLVPRADVKIVRPVEAGLISAVLVRDGDRVRAGQVLLRFGTGHGQSVRSERVAALDEGRGESVPQDHRGGPSELRAPREGIVRDMAHCAVGAAVDAGTVLMSLAPVDGDLVAEVRIRNDDVGFVHEGQRVQLELSDQPSRERGTIEGTVVRVSAEPSWWSDAQRADGEGSDSLSPYKAVVRLEAQRARGSGARSPIAAGMPVVAEVRQGDRTVMEYLLAPLGAGRR